MQDGETIHQKDMTVCHAEGQTSTTEPPLGVSSTRPDRACSSWRSYRLEKVDSVSHSTKELS